MNPAFQYVIDNRGINTESSYWYEGAQGSCRYSPYYIGTTARGIVNVESGSEDALANAVLTKVGVLSL